MCIPQSNMTQKASSRVTSTQERPTSCPAPRQRTLMAGEDEEEEKVILFFLLEVEVDGFEAESAKRPATIGRCVAPSLALYSLPVSRGLSTVITSLALSVFPCSDEEAMQSASARERE